MLHHRVVKHQRRTLLRGRTRATEELQLHTVAPEKVNVQVQDVSKSVNVLVRPPGARVFHLDQLRVDPPCNTHAIAPSLQLLQERLGTPANVAVVAHPLNLRKHLELSNEGLGLPEGQRIGVVRVDADKEHRSEPTQVADAVVVLGEIEVLQRKRDAGGEVGESHAQPGPGQIVVL
ncbi:vacuolar sorting-associated protein Vps27, putative [Babesia caballi]|uniref:Vacuolar sorting-associated protein Vps27, putative n=1 Tax=Babesia caballi TaxID=5871 RepID=A0AAV4LMY0_BABCB|nr:vacuolar sorting-associated protein Vps27, putative [Babesia caballi]